MTTQSLKTAFRRILMLAIVGFALIALTGCGIGHGPYRHGYDGRNYDHNADYYRGGYGQSGNASTDPKHNHSHRGDGSMMGYGPGRSGYCGR